MNLDDAILDDPSRLVAADTERMLASTASASAGIRAALEVDSLAALTPLIELGRPRSLCVVGAGGSSAPGEMLAAVCGRGSPVPVFAMGGPSLPGWIGPMDLVVAVSASGRTPEVLTVVAEAQRRGCAVLGIGSAGSPLHEACADGRGITYWPVARLSPLGDRQRARTMIWAMTAPLVLLAGELGLVPHSRHGLAGAAGRLDDRAVEAGVQVGLLENPAKALAVDVTAGLPMAWGSGDIGVVAARRLGRQLAENADLPCLVGALPEVARTHAGLLRGPWAVSPTSDVFRDRMTEDVPRARLRTVLLRDPGEHPDTAAMAQATIQTCDRFDVPVTEVMASGGHALEQLADLVALVDFASVYAALMLGRDPSVSAEDLDPRFGRRWLPGEQGRA